MTTGVEKRGFPDAAGPRHLAFSADGSRLYVLCELSAELHVFRRDGAACAPAGIEMQAARPTCLRGFPE